MTAKIPALFFCERGLGPSESELWVERHDPRRPNLGDELYYGLRIASGLLGEKADAGGFMLSPDDAAALHRQLGEALGVDLLLRNHALEAEVATLQADLAAAIDERDRLAKEAAESSEVVSGVYESMARKVIKIDQWKEASGLIDGHGDPDGIEPEDLATHLGRLKQLEQAAREWRVAGGPPHPERIYTDPTDVVEKVEALCAAIDALPPEAP